MTKSELENEARLAFQLFKKPAQEAITSHRCEECDELAAALHPYTPENLPKKILDKHRWDLPLLSDEGKQYYLLAWLLESIENPNSDCTDALIYAIESDHRWSPATPYANRHWCVLEAYLDFIGDRVDEISQEWVVRAKNRISGP